MSFVRPRRTWLAAGLTAVLGASLLSVGTAEAAVGTPTPAGQAGYAARLAIGSEDTGRACTAALVDPQWLAAAASCFAATPGDPVPAGAPSTAATATLGNGQTLDVVDLVPYEGRDLVLARLARSVTDVTPVKLATAAPADAAPIVATGFGRTKTEWVPGTSHRAEFSVIGKDADVLNVTGKTAGDSLCKGDTGAPLVNAAGELVAVASRSWQGGCLGESETRTDVLAARADGLAARLQSARQRPVVIASGRTLASGTVLASENAKLIMQADGNMVLYHRTGDQDKGAVLWASGTGGNAGAFARMQEDGNLVVYKKGSSGTTDQGALWASGTHGNAGARLELQGDANLVIYTKTGGHGIGGHLWHTDTYPRGDKLASDARLMPGQWISNGTHALIVDIQGNVLIREIATNREVWGKYTWNPYSWLHMQADGNLVLYRKDSGNGSGAVWASGTWGTGVYGTLDANGSLTLRWKEGGPRWSSSSLIGAQSGRCLDFNGTEATIWDCWGGANQQWDYTPAKEVRIPGNLCLTAEAGAPQTSRVRAVTCDGRAEQKWNYDGVRIASAVKPDQCVNVFGEATANGSAVGLWACGGGANEKWSRIA
ncbi:ricin-type beta-trefoil lectin domain protein (plasmid) [Streptomyces sp. BI20]|uniref:ricin-type beta-trefoil lectin domain protein n=1 Tax=Streptomyces sp. BI20 TaxID=3403460 RepID=UPI003C7511FC